MCLCKVLLPYRFTLFSNAMIPPTVTAQVLLPYRFTLFSNQAVAKLIFDKFYYLIDLHYSQTSGIAVRQKPCFTTL